MEKEQSSRGRDKIQFSRATFNRLRHETVVVVLQLLASFTTQTKWKSYRQEPTVLHALDSSPKHAASLCTE